MSNARRQIEAWLKTIDVKGSVLDVGGLFWPVRGRTKSWDAGLYDILDVKPTRNGVTAAYVCDLNKPCNPLYLLYDIVFCVEVTDHFWNPVQAFRNIATMVAKGGTLYISSNFLFPHHTGFDCIRLTRTGLEKILTETGFEVVEVKPRMAVNEQLGTALDLESKVQYHKGETGYFVQARKI